MPRPSPQTERVMAIVNLLTDAGERGATLSEIAAQLGQSRATYVHVLATLAEGGFVVRRPSDRRYHVGPALIAPGEAAAGRFPALGETRLAAEEISRALGLAVVAFVRDGDHARLIEIVWDLRGSMPALRIGDLLPIEPPLGTVFVAWEDDERISAWLDRGSTPAGMREALGGRLAAARRQGFVVELRPPAQLLPELVRLLGRGQQMRRAEHIRPLVSGAESYLSGPIDQRARYDVSTISVPVIAPGGSVTIALNLFGFEAPLSGGDVLRLGRQAREAADRLAHRLTPTAPPSVPAVRGS